MQLLVLRDLVTKMAGDYPRLPEITRDYPSPRWRHIDMLDDLSETVPRPFLDLS